MLIDDRKVTLHLTQTLDVEGAYTADLIRHWGEHLESQGVRVLDGVVHPSGQSGEFTAGFFTTHLESQALIKIAPSLIAKELLAFSRDVPPNDVRKLIRQIVKAYGALAFLQVKDLHVLVIIDEQWLERVDLDHGPVQYGQRGQDNDVRSLVYEIAGPNSLYAEGRQRLIRNNLTFRAANYL
jgi:hypothetical protein